ncbi:hypothetical protein KC352_g34082, partial [Hortaea werneckii]
IYSPLLVVTAYTEQQTARQVKFNRSRHESDDDTIEEWEQMLDQTDFEGSGWHKRVEDSKPNVIQDDTAIKVEKLQQQVAELMEMLKARQQSNGGG